MAVKPTVRELLEELVYSNDAWPQQNGHNIGVARKALAALDAEEARTRIRETDPRTCFACSFEHRNHCQAPGGSEEEVPSLGRLSDCPLNDGGRVVVRLAVAG